MKDNQLRLTGYILLALAVILILIAIYRISADRKVPVVFSPNMMSNSIWRNYKLDYLEPDTFRTMDKQRDNVTTSEGQSYTMLRSVWMDDRDTFDKSWQWTKDNLRQEEGYLFSWLFGERSDGTYGVLTEEGGHNSASDAETDIAVALIFAFARWGEPEYLEEAKLIIEDMWEQEVVTIGGKPYLAANDVDKELNGDILVNPSYLAPYAYRIFAVIDPEHDWKSLIDTSYEVIQASMREPLDKESSANLPPNWIKIKRNSFTLIPTDSQSLTTDYSYDALRTPWRLALDWIWYKEPRAEQALREMAFLSNQWTYSGAIYSEYSHDGKVLSTDETPAMYGGSIGALMVIDKEQARQLYETKLMGLFDPDKEGWKTDIGYYNENWAWFGLALYNDQLTNLWERNISRINSGINQFKP